MKSHVRKREVIVNASGAALPATLAVPADARGAILLVDVADSRQTPRNCHVASVLQRAGFATLQLDLLTPEEVRLRDESLVIRLIRAIEWLAAQPATCGLPIGLFATGDGAVPALIAATRLPDTIHAVVSYGGRPHLAGDSLAAVTSPTLLIVGASDSSAVSLNWRAFEQLTLVKKRLYAMLGTGNRFDELGALEKAAAATGEWFARYLVPAPAMDAEEAAAVLVGAN